MALYPLFPPRVTPFLEELRRRIIRINSNLAHWTY
jgi:hypothetical protein